MAYEKTCYCRSHEAKDSSQNEMVCGTQILKMLRFDLWGKGRVTWNNKRVICQEKSPK